MDVTMLKCCAPLSATDRSAPSHSCYSHIAAATAPARAWCPYAHLLGINCAAVLMLLSYPVQMCPAGMYLEGQRCRPWVLLMARSAKYRELQQHMLLHQAQVRR
jgi:hypothetical protein